MDHDADLSFWKYVVAAVVVPVVGALVTAVGYITKRLCSGFSFYIHEGWKLFETGAKKHFHFVDTMSEEQPKQTAVLEKIEAQVSLLGSDPLKTLGKAKAELVAELILAMREAGFECSQRRAEQVIEQNLKSRS